MAQEQTEDKLDPISQTQEELEVKPAEQTYVTTDQFEKLMVDVRAVLTETRGMQGVIDKRLSAQDEQRLASAKQTEREQDLQKQLSDMPEEVRPYVEPVLRNSAEIRERLETLEGQPPAQAIGTPGVVNIDDPAWKPIKDIVEDMGLDPKSESIDYAALTKPGLTERERRQTFFASLKNVATPVPSTLTETSPTTVSPPSGGTPSGGAGFSNEDDIQTAYIRGEINLKERDDAYRKKGVRR